MYVIPHYHWDEMPPTSQKDFMREIKLIEIWLNSINFKESKDNKR